METGWLGNGLSWRTSARCCRTSGPRWGFSLLVFRLCGGWSCPAFKHWVWCRWRRVSCFWGLGFGDSSPSKRGSINNRTRSANSRLVRTRGTLPSSNKGSLLHSAGWLPRLYHVNFHPIIAQEVSPCDDHSNTHCFVRIISCRVIPAMGGERRI